MRSHRRIALTLLVAATGSRVSAAQPDTEKLFSELRSCRDAAAARPPAQGGEDPVACCTRTAEAVAPTGPIAWYLLGQCAQNAERWCEAEVAYRRFAREDPGGLRGTADLESRTRQAADRCAASKVDSFPSTHDACQKAYAAGRWPTCEQLCTEAGATGEAPLLRAECRYRQRGDCAETRATVNTWRATVKDDASLAVLADRLLATLAADEKCQPVATGAPPPVTEPTDSGPSVGGWIVGGFGVGALITGAVFLGLAAGDAAELEELTDASNVEHDRVETRYRERVTIGGIVGGAGLALVATGVVVLLTSSGDDDHEGSSLLLFPSALPDGAGVTGLVRF